MMKVEKHKRAKDWNANYNPMSHCTLALNLDYKKVTTNSSNYKMVNYIQGSLRCKVELVDLNLCLGKQRTCYF